MNKIIILSLVIAFIFPLSSFAIDEATLGNGDPMKVVQAWGTDGYNTPTLKAGQGECPLWVTHGCFDISKTSYYQNTMINLAKTLKGLGYTSYHFPSMTQWFNKI